MKTNEGTIQGNVEQIELKNIHPDEAQPRKDFNAARISELISSITEHGIMSPLVIEKMSGGQYQLVDGERRFRAATELGLKKVPALIVEPMDDVDRLVKQFHLQEQHQGWSPVEKAVAIGQLAENMKLSPQEVAKMLALPARTVKDYVGFWSLLNRREYQKSEMPIALASHVSRVRRKTKALYEETYEKEFTEEMQQELEEVMIGQIKAGELKRMTDFTKLMDAFTNNPDTIKEFLKNKKTVTKLYLESNAKVSRHARNVMQLANLIEGHMKKTVELGGLELITSNAAAVRQIKRVRALLEQIQD